MQFNKDLNGQGFSTREGRYRGRCVVCGVVVVLSTSRVEQFVRGVSEGGRIVNPAPRPSRTLC